MMRQLALRSVVSLLLLLTVVFGTASARAETALDVRPAQGTLPLELQPVAGSFSAKIIVQNRGQKSLQVETRLRDGSDLDPRVPPGMTVKFATGGQSALLGPGEKREIKLDLSVPRGSRVHELYGHVLVSPADDPDPVAVGFHVSLPAAEAGLSGHLLSLILLVPFLAALLLLGMRGREPRAGTARFVVGGAALAQLALLAWASARFDREHTRFLGGDGLQLVERIALSRTYAVEWFLAVDGISLVLATVVPALVAAVAFSSTRAGELARIGGFALLLDAALVGVFFSFDLAVLGAFWVVAVVAAVLLVAVEVSDAPRVPKALALQLGIGAALVLVAIWQLSTHALPAYAMDGTPLSRVFNLTELSHGGFRPATDAWLGVHPVKAVYAALFLGCALTLALPPFHSWLSAVLGRTSTAISVLLSGGLTMLGGYGLLRIGYAALPDGTAWAAPALGALGLAAALYSAIGLAASEDLRRATAQAASLHSALVLFALSSLTAIGLSAAVVLMVSRAFWVALLLSVVSLLRERYGTTRVSELAGAASGRPLLGLLAVVALCAVAGAPGTLTFLGDISAFVGALPTRMLVALAAPIAWVIAAVGCARLYARVFLGRASLPERGAEEPDLRVLIALALLLVGLGLWPHPLTSSIESSCLDQAELVNKPGVFEVVRAPGTGSERQLAAR